MNPTSYFSVTLTDGDGKIIDSISSSTYVYLEITPNSEDYAVLKVEATYTKANDTGARTEDITDSLSSETGLYHIYLYSLEAGTDVTFTITERNLAIFKGQPFVGDYLPIHLSIYGGRTFTGFSDDLLPFTLNQAGEAEIYRRGGTSTLLISEPLITSAAEANGRWELSTSTYATLYYDDNLLVGAEYYEDTLWSSTDWIVGVKKADAADTAEDYAVYGQSFSLTTPAASEEEEATTDRYFALQVYKGEALYASLYIDESTHTVLFGATFNMIYGNNVSEDKSIYEVYDGETLLKTVGYKLTGGYENRIFLSEPYGNYVNGENTLFLDGNGNATYDGLNWTYALDADGVTISLYSGFRTIVGTLDLTNRTFAVTSDVTTEETTPGFMGKAYRGSFTDSTDEVEYLYLAFHESNYTVSSSCGGSSSLTLNGLYLNNTDIAYTYDAATMTITIENFMNFRDTATMTMTYSPAADTITITNDFNFVYKTAGCVLSNVA